MTTMFSRRDFVFSALGAVAMPSIVRGAPRVLRLGITPVFLDNDAEILTALRTALQDATGQRIQFEQRRTYEEVTGMLLEGAIDAAWLCGYPFLQHRDALALMAVPLWHGKPMYQSYLIVREGDDAGSLADLQGGTHAFSDPNSNSGFLVTASDLALKGDKTEEFFRRTIFTYGHRNVVRAVADGLVRSGSVDGYVWESLAVLEPGLAGRTRVVTRSEWLGFPPFCTRAGHLTDPGIAALQGALLGLDRTEAGRRALGLLLLDGMTGGDVSLFDGIARRMRLLASLR